MKKCKNKTLILDYIENVISSDQKVLFEKHLNECTECREELFAYKKLYELIDKDSIVLPEKEFFEKIKDNIRKEEIPLKKPRLKFWGVLAPVLGFIVFLILFNFNKEKSIEIPIYVNNLIQDENLNSLLLERLVDEELINQFNIIEEYLELEFTQILMEMDQNEKQEVIKILFNKYGELYL